MTNTIESCILYRDLTDPPPKVISASWQYIHLSNGTNILDAACGAGVSCLGHAHPKITSSLMIYLNTFPTYVESCYYETQSTEDLCSELVAGTGGLMSHAFIVSSGSEAMEAALKFTRQYFLEKSDPEPHRVHFISRRQSYHGATLGALSVGGHCLGRENFKPLLSIPGSRVSPCYPYRGMQDGEGVETYLNKLGMELEEEFQRVGPANVAAFICEPVVGAALGCVPAIPGYLSLVQTICHRHGALLILDEVMCGMGRCGSLHAWRHPKIGGGDSFIPDLQTIGKGLGGGYAPIAAVLVSPKVSDVLKKQNSSFAHGQTYQAHPMACAAALAVQREIRDNNLVQNVREVGAYMKVLLEASLGKHPNVGNIRGEGMFIGIEFVQNQETKEPFPVHAGIASRVAAKGFQGRKMKNGKTVGIALYPGRGCVDGEKGDFIMIMPVYWLTKDGADEIVNKIKKVVEEVFEEVEKEEDAE